MTATSTRTSSLSPWMEGTGRRRGGRGRAGPDDRGLRGVLLTLVPCLALAALSLLLPSTPTYDPWSWINWGREIVRLDLNTVSGPSWKPLPVLFTMPFSLAGDAAPALWLVVARTGGLLALVMAYRLAARLTGRVAGVGAAVALALTPGFVYTVALGNSEGLLIAFVLLAILRHLDGEPGQAWLLAFAAALLRPEVWPFLGLYALVLWVSEPARRRLVVGCLVLLPVLWFGPELWGSGDPLRSGVRANSPTDVRSPAFADRPAVAVLGRAASLLSVPAAVGIVVAIGHALLAFRRRGNEGLTLALTALAVAWLALVAVMTEFGFSGNLRYLLGPMAVACVLAGVGLGRVMAIGERALERRGASVGAARLAVLAAVVLALAPLAPSLVTSTRAETAKLRFQAEVERDLERAADMAGGSAAVLRCGRPATGPYTVPAVAWLLRVHGIVVGLDAKRPAVVFRTRATATSRAEPVVPRTAGLRFEGRVGQVELWRGCRSG